jgi:tetratricopeptide (TPR) repeat protein
VTEEDLDEILWSKQPPLVGAEILQSWADSPHPEDEVWPGDLLVAAGSQWALAGEHSRALDCYRRAVAFGETNHYQDPRVHLHSGLLEAGQLEEAAELERALRREPPAEGGDFAFVAETFEERGDLKAAVRWFTIGLTRTEDDDGLLTIGRFRARRAAGLPMDGIDEEALEDFPDILQRLLDDPRA